MSGLLYRTLALRWQEKKMCLPLGQAMEGRFKGTEHWRAAAARRERKLAVARQPEGSLTKPQHSSGEKRILKYKLTPRTFHLESVPPASL